MKEGRIRLLRLLLDIMKKRGIVILMVLIAFVTISGCGSDEDTEVNKISKFEKVNKTDDYRLKKQLNKTNEKLIILEGENLGFNAGTYENITFGIRNEFADTRCFYIQISCVTTLKGIACDDASFTENSDYEWTWFENMQGFEIEGNQSKSILSFIDIVGNRDTYLASIKIWQIGMIEPPLKECPELRYFSDRYGMEEYVKKDLKIVLH